MSISSPTWRRICRHVAPCTLFRKISGEKILEEAFRKTYTRLHPYTPGSKSNRVPSRRQNRRGQGLFAYQNSEVVRDATEV